LDSLIEFTRNAKIVDLLETIAFNLILHVSDELLWTCLLRLRLDSTRRCLPSTRRNSRESRRPTLPTLVSPCQTFGVPILKRSEILAVGNFYVNVDVHDLTAICEPTV
jgi:hypothetical protein